jgi:predicted XRE-type DNA-binding protein
MNKHNGRRHNVGPRFAVVSPKRGSLAVTIKRALASQIEQAMEEAHTTKTELARRMETRRSQLNRLLDPDSDSLTLETLARAAQAVGRRVTVEIV